MNKNFIVVIVVALLIIGGIYWAYAMRSADTGVPVTNQSPIVSDGNPEPGSEQNLPVEPAAAEARKDLAAKLSISEKSIVILNITETTWNDGCLGLGGPAESCLQALVPGFRVEMLANGKTYFYRTDKTGASVRAEAK